MSSTDRVREAIERVRWIGGRTVEVDVDATEVLCDLADAARVVRDWEPTVPARDDFDAGYDAGRLASADLVRYALSRLDAD